MALGTCRMCPGPRKDFPASQWHRPGRAGALDKPARDAVPLPLPARTGFAPGIPLRNLKAGIRSMLNPAP